MKTTALLLLIVALLSLQFQFNNKTEQVKSEVFKNCDNIIHLSQVFENSPNQSNLQNLRVAYKSIQKYIAYYLPSDEKILNGAPVWGVIEDGRSVDKVQPHGLQVIEENLMSDPDLVKTEINKFKTTINKVKNRLADERFSEKEIIEANRFEILRITTLGITGFENVVFSDPMRENIADLEQIKKEIKLFNNTEEITKLISEAILLIKSSSFEDLNRVKLTKDYLDPIYKKLLSLHSNLGYENISHKGIFPVNYEASSMFSNDFHNADFYTKFRQRKSDSTQISLGETLFFDPILSKNNQRSCASCHNPQKGFTDGRPKSLAYDFKGTVDRNSPTLLNSAYQSNFFWDMRSEALEDQAHHVINSSKEFNTNISEIIFKLRESQEYTSLFKNTYNDKQPINTTNIKRAITAYVRSLSSFNSPFDQYMRGETNHIDHEVIEGYNLFAGKANCATCHFAPSFNGTVPPYYFETDGEVLGVPDSTLKKLDGDLGRIKNMLPQYQYDFLSRMFKTPTVRNVKLTAPYMHNGCFNSLEDLMTFYNNGGGAGEGFDIHNQTLSEEKLQLTDQEISSIIRFMESLTDNPFKDDLPKELPKFPDSDLNNRIIGGTY